MNAGNPQFAVIPAEAGFSTAELVIHFALNRDNQVDMDARVREDDELQRILIELQ